MARLILTGILLILFVSISVATRDATIKFRNKVLSENEISETSVADLVAHIAGTPPLNSKTFRSSFPHVDLFTKPQATILIVLDAPTPENGKILNTNGHSIKRESIPRDSISFLTTLLTGSTSEQHGIIGRSWTTELGESIFAYGPEGQPAYANFPDIFSQMNEGQSLTLAVSADYQMAAALSPHLATIFQHPLSNNYAYYYNGESQHVDNVSPFGKTEIGMAQSHAQILRVLKEDLASMGCSLNENQMLLSFSTDDSVIEFDLNNQAVWKFFVELHFIQAVSKQAHTVLKPLVSDKFPDFFAIGISSLKNLQQIYGSDSATYTAALRLLDIKLDKVLGELDALYGQNNVVVGVLSLGSEANAMPNNLVQSYRYGRLSERLVRRDNETGDITPEQLTDFHISLWTTITLVLVLLATIYTMYYIDTGKDTMLFSAPRAPSSASASHT